MNATIINGKWLWKGIYPAVALSVVLVTNDTPFSQRLFLPSFYTDLLFGLGFTCIFGWYLERITPRLHPVMEDLKDAPTKVRFKRQLIWGVVIPLLALILLETVYIRFGLQLTPDFSSILGTEALLAATFMGLLNLLHLIRTPVVEKVIPIEPKYRTDYFLVTVGYSQKPVPCADIAYFVVIDKVVYLISLRNEKFLVRETLDEVMEKVDPAFFFKLNRQVIAHINSIELVGHTTTRKLSIVLRPTIAETVYVSKERAGTFLKWLGK